MHEGIFILIYVDIVVLFSYTLGDVQHLFDVVETLLLGIKQKGWE